MLDWTLRNHIVPGEEILHEIVETSSIWVVLLSRRRRRERSRGHSIEVAVVRRFHGSEWRVGSWGWVLEKPFKVFCGLLRRGRWHERRMKKLERCDGGRGGGTALDRFIKQTGETGSII